MSVYVGNQWSEFGAGLTVYLTNECLGNLFENSCLIVHDVCVCVCKVFPAVHVRLHSGVLDEMLHTCQWLVRKFTSH